MHGSLLLVAGVALLAGARPAAAYSLLTHEQLVDLTWKRSIVPLLLSRYPGLTARQLDEARAYAYGGSVIQDIGYYPFGDGFFSDLTHYVRSGDFVLNLFRDARNADELAFACGALSHYVGDSVGHAEATNRAVPIEFPRLGARYGPVVNYAQGEHPHVQTEFAFDIHEIAMRRMAPLRYLKHIGFDIPVRQVSLAYYQTYGLAEDFSGRRGLRVNVSGFRFGARRLIPRVAYALTVLHRSHEVADPATPEMARLTEEVAAVAADNQWDSYRRKPGVGTHLLAGLIVVLPKVGALKLLAIKGPTAETEQAYAASVLDSTNQLSRILLRFTPLAARLADTAALAANALPSAIGTDAVHPLTNGDLDTGLPVRPGGYQLTDRTFATLLHRLAAHPETPLPPSTRTAVLAYYADPSAPIATKRDPAKWAQVQADLKTLAAMPVSEEAEPFATYAEAQAALN